MEENGGGTQGTTISESASNSEGSAGTLSGAETQNNVEDYPVEDDPGFIFSCNGRDFTLVDNIADVKTIFTEPPV